MCEPLYIKTYRGWKYEAKHKPSLSLKESIDKTFIENVIIVFEAINDRTIGNGKRKKERLIFIHI